MNSEEINEATLDELRARLEEISNPDPNHYDPMASLEAFTIKARLDSVPE